MVLSACLAGVALTIVVYLRHNPQDNTSQSSHTLDSVNRAGGVVDVEDFTDEIAPHLSRFGLKLLDDRVSIEGLGRLEDYPYDSRTLGSKLASVPKLQYFSCFDVAVDDEFLIGFQGSSVYELRVLGYKVEVAGMEAISRLQLLSRLSISGGSLDADELGHLGGMRDLTFLDLDFISLDEDGMGHLVGLQGLEHLGLHFCKFSEASFISLIPRLRLKTLNLDGSQVSNRSIQAIAASDQLRQVDLSFTDVTDTAVAQLRRDRPDLIVKYRGPRPE